MSGIKHFDGRGVYWHGDRVGNYGLERSSLFCGIFECAGGWIMENLEIMLNSGQLSWNLTEHGKIKDRIGSRHQAPFKEN